MHINGRVRTYSVGTGADVGMGWGLAGHSPNARAQALPRDYARFAVPVLASRHAFEHVL